jgi:inner membrane protein
VASARQHMAIGATVAVGGYLAYCYFRRKKVDGLELFGFGLIGASAGLLPDMLEPAIHSHHRQFFHSYAAAGLLAYANRAVWENPLVPHEQKVAFSIASGSYFSHLVADGQTPRGIPLVGRLGF